MSHTDNMIAAADKYLDLVSKTGLTKETHNIEGVYIGVNTGASGVWEVVFDCPEYTTIGLQARSYRDGKRRYRFEHIHSGVISKAQAELDIAEYVALEEIEELTATGEDYSECPGCDVPMFDCRCDAEETAVVNEALQIAKNGFLAGDCEYTDWDAKRRAAWAQTLESCSSTGVTVEHYEYETVVYIANNADVAGAMVAKWECGSGFCSIDSVETGIGRITTLLSNRIKNSLVNGWDFS